MSIDEKTRHGDREESKRNKVNFVNGSPGIKKYMWKRPSNIEVNVIPETENGNNNPYQNSQS